MHGSRVRNGWWRSDANVDFWTVFRRPEIGGASHRIATRRATFRRRWRRTTDGSAPALCLKTGTCLQQWPQSVVDRGIVERNGTFGLDVLAHALVAKSEDARYFRQFLEEFALLIVHSCCSRSNSLLRTCAFIPNTDIAYTNLTSIFTQY